MDYNRDMVVDSYRDIQRAVPGVEALYLLVRTIIQAALPAANWETPEKTITSLFIDARMGKIFQSE